MEEETASTLWTSLAKEHIFPKNAMEQIDPRKFNVKLDTEIDYLCEKENCGRHPITLAKLLGSEQSRHFLEQNEHLEKYEAERLQLEKEEALKKQQEAERIRREQEEALKKQQEAERIRREEEEAFKKQQEAERIRRENEEALKKHQEAERIRREEEEALKKQQEADRI
eukprot:380483_1